MDRLVEDAKLGWLLRLTGDPNVNAAARLALAKLLSAQVHRLFDPLEQIEPHSVKAKASKPKPK